MILLIRGLEGPFKDRYFQLKPGMTIGRKTGDILLENDPMVSSLHGRIIGRGDGRFALEDAGSQNQFIVNGQQVAKVDLIEGASFQVGKSVFMVVSAHPDELSRLPIQKSWKDSLFDILENNIGLSTNIKPLNPAVRIEGLVGANAEDSWVLGFGPRVFGPLSDDIEILEKHTSDIAFEIDQGEHGPQLISRTKELTLNQKEIAEGLRCDLKEGDEIRFGASVYRVGFI